MFVCIFICTIVSFPFKIYPETEGWLQLVTYIELSEMCVVNPFQTKSRMLYLKTQFVPRCKHFSSRL